MAAARTKQNTANADTLTTYSLYLTVDQVTKHVINIYITKWHMITGHLNLVLFDLATCNSLLKYTNAQ